MSNEMDRIEDSIPPARVAMMGIGA